MLELSSLLNLPAAIVRSVSEAHGKVPTGSSRFPLYPLPELDGRRKPVLNDTILQESCAKRVSAPCASASRSGTGALGRAENLVGTVKARRKMGGDFALSGVEGAVATFILARGSEGSSCDLSLTQFLC